MILKDLLRAKKITSKELASILGVHYNTISGWNTQKTQIPDKFLPKLAEIFEVDMSEILELKYDFSDKNMDRIAKEGDINYKRINEFSDLKKTDIKALINTHNKMLVKVETGISKLLSNGNDIESLGLLDQYLDMKKKILKTIADLEVNL